ncbi:MAG: nucleotide sugar dehydrogenase, partial [Elusimicrobiota bacterium]
MKKINICVVGAGYVGLVTATCLAELGHDVVCVDSDAKKLKALRGRKVPIYEPGLDELFQRAIKAKRLRFAGSVQEGMAAAQVIFIAVGTPPRADGSADLSAVEAVAEEVACNLKGYAVIVDKSTVPVETGDWVAKTVARFNKKGLPFDVVSNPEFLSEGTAVKDFLNPDRIVLGVTSPRAEAVMRQVYAPIKAPVLVTDVKSAELIKHASNSFLATKISFINAVSILCEKVGADVGLVA